MKCLHKLIKTILIITFVFIFSDAIKAGVNPNDCNITISREEELAAHFDVQATTCNWVKVEGIKRKYLGTDHYPTEEEAIQYGKDLLQEELDRLKKMYPKEEYEKIVEGSLEVPRCNSGGGSITTSFNCHATWGGVKDCKDEGLRCVAWNSCTDKYGRPIGGHCGCAEYKCKWSQVCRCGAHSSVFDSGDTSSCCPKSCNMTCNEVANKPQWDNLNGAHPEYKSALDDPNALIDSYVRLSDKRFVRVISDGWVARQNGGSLAGDVPTVEEFVRGTGYTGSGNVYNEIDGKTPISAVDRWLGINATNLKEQYETLPKLMYSNDQTTIFNFYKTQYNEFKDEHAEIGCEKYGSNEGFGNYIDCDCDTHYYIDCPVYQCIPQVEQSGVCTETYHSSTLNADVYGVNPTLHFTYKTESGKISSAKTQIYKKDDTYNFRDCNTSYQSEGCGYANILIEAEYIKKHGSDFEKTLLDYQTINLALRLFGAHLDTKGFMEAAGLGTTRTVPGTDGKCDWDALYLYAPSTYKLSETVAMMFLKHITETYSSNNQNYPYGDYISPAMLINDRTIDLECGVYGYGTMCHVSSWDSYRNRKTKLAMGLFFNTVLGNSKMKEHRDEIFGYTYNRIQSVELIGEGDSETKSRLVVDFGDIHVDKIENGVVYKCDNESLNSMDPEVANYIRKYCQLKMIYSYEKNGQTYTVDVMPEYCSGKHALRCTTQQINVAVCDKTTLAQEQKTNQTVTVTYPDEKGVKEIDKMIACENPDQVQEMYGVVGSDDTNDGNNTETYEVTNYECNRTFCHDLTLREKDASVIPPQTKADYEKIKSGDVSTGHIKDPSLKCILNASAENKLKYDFSELFGVNTNFCRVYCSDEVEYYIPDKETIKDGQSLKYDIAIRSYLKEKKDHMISSVVKEKRTCASEIYYNNFPRAINWGSIYGFTLKDQGKVLGYTNVGNVKKVNSIYNWKQLFDILHSLTGSGSGDVSGEIITENLNEIIYDLYNCNFYSAKDNNNMFKKNNIIRPRQRAFGGNEINQNVYDYYIANEFDVNNDYGLVGVANSNDGKCPYDSKSGRLSCMQMRNIEYKGGSEMTDGSNIGGNGTNNNIDIDNVSSATIEKVRYCRDAESITGQCFGYTEGVLNGSPEDLQSYIYERMDDKTKEYELNKKKKAQVPVNDYAILTVVTEVGFFNKTKFQSEPSTGKVSKIENGPDTGRLKVDDYTYPVSKNAFAMCSKESKQENYYYDEHKINYPLNIKVNNFYKPEEFNNCKVIHSYQNLNTYHRAQFNDNFHSKISNYQAGTYYEVTASQPQCTEKNGKCLKGLLDVGEYRNVNRENIFPFKINYDNSNWDTKEGVEAQNNIENANQEIFLNDDYLQYSFEMSPAQLNNIKRYNLTAKDYVEVEVDDCELFDKKRYLNCRSVENGLLSEIRQNQSNAASTSYATIIDNHDGSDLFFSNSNTTITN